MRRDFGEAPVSIAKNERMERTIKKEMRPNAPSFCIEPCVCL